MSEGLEVRSAGLLRRSLAGALDLAPLLGLMVWGGQALVDVGAAPLWPSEFGLLDRLVDTCNHRPDLVLTPLGLLAVGLVIWHLLGEVLLGASPGKRLLGLVVVDRGGRRPRALRAGLRAILRPLGMAALGLGPLWAFADPERRTLHDRITGTWLVRAADLAR